MQRVHKTKDDQTLLRYEKRRAKGHMNWILKDELSLPGGQEDAILG